MPTWYLIRSKLAEEFLAQSNLERQGFSVYLPRVISAVTRRGRRRDEVIPLFPRYLFLQVHDTQSLGPVRSTAGVSDVVRFGAMRAIVPDRVVEEVRSRADPETGLHRLSCSTPLQPGASVRVTAGPFDGLQGIFERRAGAERVVLLLNLLGGDTRVRVPSDAVASAKEAA